MIDDSVPWKDDLLRLAARLSRRRRQRRWTTRTSYLVERDVMTGAYAVRKLLEAYKISDEVSSVRVRARRHRLTGRPPDLLDRWSFWEHYNLAEHVTHELTLREFCNQIIHSWVFALSATDDSTPLFDGIFVSSDRERRRFVYFIAAETLVEVFSAVGQDDIVSMRIVYNSVGDRTIVVASSRLDAKANCDKEQLLRDSLAGFASRQAAERAPRPVD